MVNVPYAPQLRAWKGLNANLRGKNVANGGDNGASVEEILESIKKVMERDSRANATRARQRKVEEAEQADADAESKIAEASPVDEQVDGDEVLDLADLELAELVEVEDEDGESPLIADEVRGAMQENLAALAMLAEPPAKPQIVRSGETSLEGLTRELLRPMLAEWLDQNLPGMVEKLVQAEIARIAGKRG